jgi:hypothetical protein
LINVTSTPTPTILGSVATYQWERQEFGSLTWNSIPGGVAQLPTYDPPMGSVTQTTSFRRVISYTNSTTKCDLPQNLSESSVHVIYVTAHPGGCYLQCFRSSRSKLYLLCWSNDCPRKKRNINIYFL